MKRVMLSLAAVLLVGLTVNTASAAHPYARAYGGGGYSARAYGGYGGGYGCSTRRGHVSYGPAYRYGVNYGYRSPSAYNYRYGSRYGYANPYYNRGYGSGISFRISF